MEELDLKLLGRQLHELLGLTLHLFPIVVGPIRNNIYEYIFFNNLEFALTWCLLRDKLDILMKTHSHYARSITIYHATFHLQNQSNKHSLDLRRLSELDSCLTT